MSYPTPYPDINALLIQLLAEVKVVLGRQFVGLYLYGSLADGDFNPDRSDIDFLVVTAGTLPTTIVAALEEMHTRLADGGSKWASKLEGSYLPQAELRRYDYDAGPFPQINEGRFYSAGHGYDWIIQRHILRRHGIVIAGPPLAPMIDPVSAAELRRAVHDLLQDWWAPMLDDSNSLHGRPYQAFAVLTMCRALYTQQHGAVVPKTAAAHWALNTLDAKWRPLITSALAWPHGPQPDELQQTLAFIRYTLAAAA